MHDLNATAQRPRARWRYASIVCRGANQCVHAVLTAAFNAQLFALSFSWELSLEKPEGISRHACLTGLLPQRIECENKRGTKKTQPEIKPEARLAHALSKPCTLYSHSPVKAQRGTHTEGATREAANNETNAKRKAMLMMLLLVAVMLLLLQSRRPHRQAALER